MNAVVGMTILERGALMRMVRRAAALAVEEQRSCGRITDPLQSALALYTDDASAAAYFYALHLQGDLASICKVSTIESICIVGQSGFPPHVHEADRPDDEYPRVAAMWLPATGEKCPRCWNYTVPAAGELCARCEEMLRVVQP